jgi:hypothetical protein
MAWSSSVSSASKTAWKGIKFEWNPDEVCYKYVRNDFRRDAYEEKTRLSTILPRRLSRSCVNQLNIYWITSLLKYKFTMTKRNTLSVGTYVLMFEPLGESLKLLYIWDIIVD